MWLDIATQYSKIEVSTELQWESCYQCKLFKFRCIYTINKYKIEVSNYGLLFRKILKYHGLLLKLGRIIKNNNTKIMIHRVSMGDKVTLMDAFFLVKVIGPSLKKTDILFLLKIRSWQQGNCPEALSSSLIKT